MPDYRETENLEEQLRRDRRLAATHRRRKRMRWLIPVLLLAAVAAVLLYLLIRPIVEKNREKKKIPVQADAEATLVFVGDLSLDAEAIEAFRTDSGFDFSSLFAAVTPQIASADLAVANLEGNIVEPDGVGDHNYPFRFLRDLSACGFDVLLTANSCSIDNGITGLFRTRQAILDAGMQPVGTFSDPKERESAGGVLIKDVNGIRIAFIGVTKSLNGKRLPEDAEYSVNLLYEDYYENGASSYTKVAKDEILSLINAAKAESPDVVIALLHWGSEYENVTDAQRRVAAFLFDNGVDLIIGSHSHLVGPMEQEKNEDLPHDLSNGFVAYGLGDFLSAEPNESGRAGCILSLRILKHNGKLSVDDIVYTPTYSACPSEDLETEYYEILNAESSIAEYESDYYDKVSGPMYELLKKTVARAREQTGWEN